MLIGIEKHAKATYSMSGKNLLCPNDQNINTESECKQAAMFIGKTFKDSRARKGLPKGCYFHHSNGNIHFNTHSTGRENNQAEQICKVGRIEGMLVSLLCFEQLYSITVYSELYAINNFFAKF